MRLLIVCKVVHSHSAILPGYIPIGIRANHMDMTKFEDVNDPGFVAIAGELGRWSRELASAKAPKLVPTPGAGANPGSQNQMPAPASTGAMYNGISIARSVFLRVSSEKLYANTAMVAFRPSLLSTSHNLPQARKKTFC
jgi:hypothetical protein